MVVLDQSRAIYRINLVARTHRDSKSSDFKQIRLSVCGASKIKKALAYAGDFLFELDIEIIDYARIWLRVIVDIIHSR